MTEVIYDAAMRGDAVRDGESERWVVNFAKDCTDPYRVNRESVHRTLRATYLMPCRRCAHCRHRNMGHWAYRAIHETTVAAEAGRRTWFGTLTLRPEAVSETLWAAVESYMDRSSTGEIEDFWDDPKCDYRFERHREVLLEELKKYWKRLRKSGLEFRYFVAFERHKSGVPHIHWLLHETGDPIRKRKLQDQWPHGFAKVKLVGGYCKKRRRVLKPEFAAFYVCKYLQKHYQPGRQCASLGYGKSSS